MKNQLFLHRYNSQVCIINLKYFNKPFDPYNFGDGIINSKRFIDRFWPNNGN